MWLVYVGSGVSIDSASEKGYTPLMKAIAAASPFVEIPALLVSTPKLRKQGPQERTFGNNHENANVPDFHASQFENEIVKVILAFNPDLMKRDALGKTAFDWARCTGNVHALALLESHLQASSLHHTASSTREQRITACRALLQRHEEYVASTEAFLTKHSFGENEFVQFLNASRSQMPREEFSVCVDGLKMAHAQPASENPVFFIDHETRQGWTPLTKCASNGYVEAVQVLLEMGATLHHETRLRHTAMTWACYCGHEAVVLYLLRIGVNVDQKTREGKTALIHAVSNAQAKIVHHLLLALRERSLPVKAKDAFDSQLTLLNRRKSIKSAWKRMNAEDAPIENKLEWHETFCNLIHWRDQSGKGALDYATHMAQVAAGSCGSSNVTVVLDCLQSALYDAQNHLEYVEANEARTLAIPCSSPGCRFIGPRDTMTIHEKYQCVKRTIHCDYCSEPIVFETQQEHEKNGCVQRKVPCVNLQFGCHDRVLFSDLSNHASHHCRKRLMECRLLCGQVLLFEELFAHETTQCSLRTIECAWGCPSTFMAKESGNHQRKQCPKRLVPCVGGRRSTTRASQRQSGSNTALTSGCGMQVVAEEMQFHLTHLCENRKVACKWAIHGCEEAIGGSAESRYHHEERACPFRLVPCRNECELSGGLLACFLPEHYEWQCLLENKPCPNKCPAPVIVEDGSDMNSDVLHLPAHLLDVHVLEDAGDCPKRLARCPLDLCGKHVNLFGMRCNRDELENGTRSSLRAMRQRVRRSQHFLDRLCAVICDTTATDYDTTSVNDQADEILEICTRSSTTKQLLVDWSTGVHRKLTCELDALESEAKARSLKLRVLMYAEDKHLLEFSDGHSEWIPLQSREYDVVLQSQQQISKHEPAAMNANLRATAFQCPLIEADNLKVHMETECHLRLLPCPLACGQRLPVHGIATHIAKRCNVRNVKCRLGCGAVLPFISLMEHEEQTCELRVVLCEHCHESIPWRSMTQHLEKTCTKLPRRCRLGCGLEVSRSESAIHEESECPKRLVLCTQCKKSIWFGERDFHEQHECPLRIYGVCEANCGETLRHNEVGHHLLFNCSQRVVTCAQCDQRTVFAKLQEHKALQCPQRVLFCHRGCGHAMKEIDAEAHEEGECVKRLVYCSNRCGLEVPYCALNNHLEVECNMRVIECPRGCQERLFAYQIETHWRRCRQRVVPCGTGTKACARPIRLWVSVRKLVRCATHNDNALLWALKCQDDDLVTYLLQQVTPITAAFQDEFSNGFSPLTMAVNVGNVEIVKLLLRFGADVNLETSRGRTPLAEACLAQNPELVDLLLEHRANVSHTNRHGQNLMTMVRALAATVAPDDALAQEKWKTIITLLEERETMERDQRELFLTIATSNYDYVASFLKYSATSSNEPTLRFNQLESLQAALHEHEKQVAQAKIELTEAIRVLNESVADAEAKTVNVAHLSEQIDDCASLIQRVDYHHDASEANSNALEAEMLKLIREITAQNIAQLLNIHVPSDKYLVVMKAICMISGVLPRGRRSAAEYTDMEWWKAAQALLMDRTLLQRLRGYRKQVVTPDVMAKVRRECMRTPAFAAASVFSSGGESEDAMKVPTEERKSSALPTVDELRGDIVSLLAAWVKGVEMEYKTRSERQTLGERKRRLAISLHATQGTLQQARFNMQVATRSLPARQEEVEIARSKAEGHEKEHFAAQQRLKTYKILNFAALNGHTPLTFAAAVGNEAMVHMLLTHGAVAGYAEEEQHLCASFVQLIVRDHLQKRRKQRRTEDEKSKVSSVAVAMKPRSDEAMNLLVRNIAYTFLLGHYRRKIAFFRQTNRVALHEAIFNGFPSIIEILLANDARLWQKTHVLPLRVVPGTIDNASSGRGTETLSGGWKLTPLLRRVHVLDDTREPMTTKETLALAMERYDCATYRQGHGWDPNVTHYSDTNTFVTSAFEKVDAELRHRQKEIAARKTVAKKTAELKVLHAALETSIIARDFHVVAQLWDQGAYADYETHATGVTALMAACIGEVYLQNIDKRDVLAVEFLLDRSRNQPFVNFESSSGRTALNTCAFHGTMMCAQTLIDRGVNANFASRKHGKTALMVAAANGNVDFVRFLLQQPEVDIWAQDKQGKTAFDHAQEHGFDDVVHLLGAALAGHRGHFYSSVSALYGVCKWGCGFMTNSIGNAVQHSEVIQHMHPMTHHETHTCPKRHVVCPNQCGRADLWAESLNEHVAEECAMRIVTCKQPKCGATLPFTHLSTHDRDECELRMIHCECDEFMTYQKHVVHAQTRCSMRLVPCPLECGDGVKLRFMDLKMHQRNECPNRRVRCRNGCSANELLFKQREYHEDHLCSLRRVRCKWGCDETVLANTQQYHESGECLRRQLACPNKCGQMNVAFLDIEHHATEMCAHRLVVCSMGCGRKVSLHTMENHVLRECRKRNVTCELCNLVLVEDDKLAHQRSSCPQRISLCGLCGQTNIPYAELTAHRSDSCKMRQVTCKYNCFVKLLLAHEKERHETSECALRPVWCPLGCRDVLIANAVKKHERVCIMRFVVCSLGCGTELREKDRVEHETLHCPSVSTFKRRL
uniref:TRAF-type domain-containing protein n=1 Tax=Globisporangium ultimum (strain ATCC 200006 / CBS 805.95 / DAOM BR144) TaxID=431595 RepID=K3WII2_GLOUD